jgi:hypothetical protein
VQANPKNSKKNKKQQQQQQPLIDHRLSESFSVSLKPNWNWISEKKAVVESK